MVRQVLPYLSSSVTAGGGVNAPHSSTKGYEQLLAARTLPELPERFRQSIPLGHMPSASLASVHAAAAKSTSTALFSQHQQVVTPSDNAPDPSVKADRSGEDAGRNSWADMSMSEDVPETTTGGLSSNRRPLSPPAFPILDQTRR